MNELMISLLSVHEPLVLRINTSAHQRITLQCARVRLSVHEHARVAYKRVRVGDCASSAKCASVTQG